MQNKIIFGVLAAAFAGGLAASPPASASPLAAHPGSAAEGGLLTDVQYYGGSRYRQRSYNERRSRGVSPQAGVRCGNHGCWRNDRYGRPTGERFYYRNRYGSRY